MTTPSNTAPSPRAGSLLLAVGVVLPWLAIAAYIGQVTVMKNLTKPWYVPILTALGALCVLLALVKRRSLVRYLALGVLVLLAGLEWAALTADRLPDYTGPIAEGKPFPVFATIRADGSKFTQRDLEGEQKNVMVFFRGRW